MDATAKRLERQLDGGDIELRMATMRVVTALGIKSRSVIHSLGRALREDSESLRILALKGLMRLGATDVVEMVIPLILEPGELREHALAVVVAIGEPANVPLEKLYPNADFHGKRAVATALSRIGAARSVDFLLRSLLVEPFELQKHLSLCLCEAIDNLTPREQNPIFGLVKKFLALPKVKKDLQSQVVALILLGHFRSERNVKAARSILRAHAQPRSPTEVRRYAMMSLARSIMEAPVAADLSAFLRKCLCDDDWHNIAQHALAAFQRIDLPNSANPGLVRLLRDSPHFSVHIHVFERLTRDSRPDVAKAIIPFLQDSRYRVRDAAEKVLRSIPLAMGDLFSALSDAVDNDFSHRLHSIVQDYPQEVKRKYLDRAIKRFMTLYERNDRRARFFLELVRSIDPEPLRRKIYRKVDSLRKGRSKDRWVKISRHLQILWDHHLITSAGRYVFATALIRQSSKDLSPHARRANLGLQVIRALIYDDTPRLVASLTKSKDLTVDDLFYIGFHFMEEGEELRPFARVLLEYLSRKFSTSKVGRAAAQKLVLYEASEAKPSKVRSGVKRGGRVTAAARTAAARAGARAVAAGKKPAGKAPAQTRAVGKTAPLKKTVKKPAAKKNTAKKPATKELTAKKKPVKRSAARKGGKTSATGESGRRTRGASKNSSSKGKKTARKASRSSPRKKKRGR